MARSISQEQPPQSVEIALREWLSRRFIEVGMALSSGEDYEVHYTIPTKTVVGMTRYFGAAIPTTPITAEGLWIFKSTGWTQIV